jgi:2-isopropylmalate synthase
MSTSTQITLYDTTLRDGAQGEGIHFSLADKLRLAQRLDAFGMHYIEGGWPGSNEKDIEFFREAKKLKFRHAKLAAFGSTRRANTAVEKDPQVALLLEAGTPVVTLVCKSSMLHVTEILRTTPSENLGMIVDTIRYLVAHGREVIFDGEHTFDGYKLAALESSENYTAQCYVAAAEAGASYLVMCDTNGGSLPSEISQITNQLAHRLALAGFKSAKLGIHTHDDCGLGVANALAGIEAGALQIQGTVNGYGERTGNCNLVTSIANLQLKMGHRVLSDDKLAELRDLSLFVDEVANQRPSGRAPFVGSAAFAHKGGIHVNAVNKFAGSYEHIEPGKVGNRQRVLVGELAGRANVMLKAKTLGLKIEEKSPQALAILEEIKRLENQGYEFEAADASFELLVRKALGEYTPYFELGDYHVSIRKDNLLDRDTSEATIKITVKGETVHEVAEGDGPVNALDAALRKALVRFYPRLAAMTLVDYKVRIVDSAHGTAAKTRVFIESSDGDSNWATVGVSKDIIEASWIALRDSVEFALMQLSQQSRLLQSITTALLHSVEKATSSSDELTRLLDEGQFRRPDLGSLHKALLHSLTREVSSNDNLARLLRSPQIQEPDANSLQQCLLKIVSGLAFSTDDFNRWAKDLEPQKFNLTSLSDALSRSITKAAFSSEDFERLLKKSEGEQPA